MKMRYSSVVRMQQWAAELQSIKQQEGEKVGAYAVKGLNLTTIKRRVFEGNTLI